MSIWNNVDNTELGEDDFQSVHDAVGTLAGVWRQFGAALGLAPSALREIDEANRGMPAQCLFSAIDRWLRQDYNYERYGPSSWRRLVMAVECNTGGQNAALAKTIAKKHFIAPGPTSEDPDDQYVEMQAVPPEDNQYEEMQAEPTPPGEIGPAQPEQGWEQAVQSSEPITHEQQMESEPAATSEHLDNLPKSTQPATVISMKQLQNDLALIAHKWYNIGLQLGVPAHDLDKINRDGTDAQRLLNDTLLHWLSNNPTAKKGDLETMLRSNTISEAKLARKLLKVQGLPENEPLQEAHLKTLVEFLDPVASRWEDIGIQLGINPRVLDTLKKRGCATVEAALSQVLRKLDSLEPSKTVDDLVQALSSSSVAEKVYAEQLRSRYGNGYILHAPASDHQGDNHPRACGDQCSESSEHVYEQIVLHV